MDPAGRQRDIDRALCRIAARRTAGAIASGCAAIDAALGTGGFPRGRITEIYGPSAGGKTTVALHAIAACQKAGGTAAFLDADHAFDAAYAQRIGVNLENLVAAQPGTGEEALEMMRSLAASDSVDLAVLDSVAALVPRLELASGGMIPHLHRRIVSQALRRIARAAARTGACLLFLNQVRHQSGGAAGNPERPTGGPALGLRAAIRAEVRAVAPLYRGETLAGRRTRFSIRKNLLAAPFGEAEFDVFYGEGIRDTPQPRV